MWSTSRNLLGTLLILCLLQCQSERIRRIDSLFSAYAGKHNPGAALMVIKQGQIQLTRSYGMADLENQIPVSESTNFRLASMTKAFTALSILQLIETGQLEFSTTLSDIFPDFPAYGKTVTVYQLLHHVSGLAHYENLLPDSFSGQVMDKDVLTLMMQEDSTLFSPGTRYDYSNSGYAVLSQIVREISGVSFPDYLTDHIFEPLGMNGSLAYVQGEANIRNRAYGYQVLEDTVMFSDQSPTSAVLGDGGVYSSLGDMFLWDQALYSDALVNVTLLDSAFSPRLENYGCGWRIDTYRGHRRINHTGSTCGFRNVFQRFPDDELSVTILTNRREPGVQALAEKVIDMYLFNE